MHALSISEGKGTPKRNVPAVELRAEYGLVGDAHAGPGHRQVSLLALESIAKMQAKGAAVGPGAFAENITTEGLAAPHLRVGDRLVMGEVELEVTQLGKECHHHCAIYRQVGECVMPREGVFARVRVGGRVAVGEEIVVREGSGWVGEEVTGAGQCGDVGGGVGAAQRRGSRE